MNTLAEMVKVNVFRTPDVNPRLATARGAFIQEKVPNHNKHTGFVAFELGLFLSPSPQLHGSLQIQPCDLCSSKNHTPKK